MTGRTENYSLSTIADSGDGTLSDDGFKYTNDDRQLIDRLLFADAHHHHTGNASVLTAPTEAPELSLDTTGGTLQAGVRIYYKFTLVDANGFESAASPESSIDTPTQVSTPGAPTLTNQATTGGTLPPGSYYYVLSAYSGGVSTQETGAGPAANIVVPAGTSTNVIRVTFPSLPANATGWNIYVKTPGSTQYYFLTSVDMDVATPPTYYDDDGSPAVDCARISPTVNTTLNTNAVTVSYPGATPTVPDGYTWRIYRTFILNNYNNSLLHWVVEETVPGIVDAEYIDIGTATASGSPPQFTQTVDNPDPVDLTDAIEVQGRLPLGNVTAFPFVATFVAQGPLIADQFGTIPWRNPFPSATVVRIEAQLSYDDGLTFPVAAAGNIYCSVWHVRVTDNWDWGPSADIANNNLIIPGGEHHIEVNYADLDPTEVVLAQGDLLTVDVGMDTGATPTAQSCVVNVVMLAQFTAATSDPTLWE